MIKHIIRPNGKEGWYQNGVSHKLDGPALIEANGTELWLNNKYFNRKYDLLLFMQADLKSGMKMAKFTGQMGQLLLMKAVQNIGI